MLDVQYRENVAVIDVRDSILRGEHPKGEILQFVIESANGSIIEIHLPHRAEPLIAGLASMGIHAIVNQLEPNHFRMMCVKL